MLKKNEWKGHSVMLECVDSYSVVKIFYFPVSYSNMKENIIVMKIL